MVWLTIKNNEILKNPKIFRKTKYKNYPTVWISKQETQ